MTPFQKTTYNSIIQYLLNQQTGFQFTLSSGFYLAAVPNLTLTAADKRAIGMYFRKQVQTGTISVAFDYLYGTCLRCGYKDSSNHIHYITI